jgi:hypothetical protein
MREETFLMWLLQFLSHRKHVTCSGRHLYLWLNKQQTLSNPKHRHLRCQFQGYKSEFRTFSEVSDVNATNNKTKYRGISVSLPSSNGKMPLKFVSKASRADRGRDRTVLCVWPRQEDCIVPSALPVQLHLKLKSRWSTKHKKTKLSDTHYRDYLYIFRIRKNSRGDFY